MMKKIVAFAGSNSYVSINKELIKYTAASLGQFDVNFLDLNDFEMPVYSLYREKNEGVPEQAHRFRKLMHEADGIVMSVAEHNWSIAATLKNLLDWCSRVDMNIFNHKPMLLMSASISKAGGVQALNYMLYVKDKFSMNVVETFSLPSFNHSFADGRITDEYLKTEHNTKVTAFAERVGR